MPNPRDKAKATGDTHLPEVESEDLSMQGSHPEGTGTPGTQARHRDSQGRGSPRRGGNHGGEIRDREAPSSDVSADGSGEESK